MNIQLVPHSTEFTAGCEITSDAVTMVKRPAESEFYFSLQI